MFRRTGRHAGPQPRKGKEIAMTEHLKNDIVNVVVSQISHDMHSANREWPHLVEDNAVDAIHIYFKQFYDDKDVIPVHEVARLVIDVWKYMETP
jgi:hypothetical protein